MKININTNYYINKQKVRNNEFTIKLKTTKIINEDYEGKTIHNELFIIQVIKLL